MHLQIAFLSGFVTACWGQLQVRPPAELSGEVALLRRELESTRTLIVQVKGESSECERDRWVQGWLIRAGVLVDFGLVGWIVVQRHSPSGFLQRALADTGGSSSSDKSASGTTGPR